MQGIANINSDDIDTSVSYSNENDEISMEERESIARVVNCISALAKRYMYINDTVIVYTYEGKIIHQD